jgi:16S rRNA (guanine527-N7)-methyltransferase
MGTAFDAALELGIGELELDHQPAGSARARRTYEVHAQLLRDWNEAINLTAIRDPAEVARRHICDSLSAASTIGALLPAGGSLLDLGSGAGYPGLPLAVAVPLGRLGLLDSVGKKARFLGVVSRAVGAIMEEDQGKAPAIEIIAERAEDVAQEPDHRGAWDVVTARAVGSLAEVLELSLPLTREGGAVVAWKREDGGRGLGDELREAGSIIRAAGGGRPSVVTIVAPCLPGHRLVVVGKDRPTPAAYPRAAAERKRHRR